MKVSILSILSLFTRTYVGSANKRKNPANTMSARSLSTLFFMEPIVFENGFCLQITISFEEGNKYSTKRSTTGPDREPLALHFETRTSEAASTVPRPYG